MAPNQLREYVQQAAKLGASPDQIKSKLAEHGWAVSDIEAILQELAPAPTTPAAPGDPGGRYLEASEKIEVKYATLERRIAAFTIDFLILLPLNFFAIVLILVTGREGATVIIPVWLVVLWFYFAIQESSGAEGSIGKKLLGIYVVRSYGEAIDFSRASKRFFAKFLSTLSLGFGVIWMKYNPMRQTFHDLIADTVVVNRDPGPNPEKVALYTKLGIWSFFILVVLPVVIVLAISIFNLVKPAAVPPSSSNPEVTDSAAAQARDASRKTDITTYAASLAAYNSTHHSYPKSTNDATAPSPSGIFNSSGPLQALSSGFPVDPFNGQSRCQPTSVAPKVICSYHYLSSGTSYVLWAELELPGSGGGVYFVDSTSSSGLTTSDPASPP